MKLLLAEDSVLMHLSRACAEIGRLNDPWHYIDEAMRTVETTKEKMWEAEVHRIPGELTLTLPEQNLAKAEAYFECALVIARYPRLEASKGFA